jgi:cyclopropane fatty-acyl-phospholipid synthase-like methyltransferase
MPAFDAIAHEYDRTFTETATGRLQRARVRYFASQLPVSGGTVLELNCGTGVDAVWLAEGYERVLATDISENMLEVTRQHVQRAGLAARVKVFRVDAGQLGADLARANDPGPFEAVFSNFGGLNCLSPRAMSQLSEDAAAILRPGARLMVVMIGRFCWWETLYFLLKGQWRTAFRRWSRGPVSARLDAETTVDTWYYSPAEMARLFPQFTVKTVQPVGFWVPPSYLDPLMARFPGLLAVLSRLEQRTSGRFWAGGSDHYWLVLERRLGG